MTAARSSLRASRARGVTLTEYALLLLAIVIVTAGGYKALGGRVSISSDRATATLASLDGGAVGPGIGGGGNGGGGRGGGIGGFFRDFVDGFIKGDYSTRGSWGSIAGQVVAGFVPIYGQIGDIRDTTAAIRDIAQGRPGGWVSLGATAVGYFPGFGDAAKAAIKAGREGVQQGAKNADEAAALIAGAVKKNDDTAAAVVGGARRSADEIAAAARKAQQWADDNWDAVQKLPPGNTPGLSYSGFPSDALGSIQQGGLKSGEALGKAPGPNSSKIWFKEGDVFYYEGMSVAIPTNRLEELGGVKGVGLAGQKGVITVPHAKQPNGIPFDEFAVVVPAGNGYVIPVHIPPGWTGPAFPVPPGWKP